MKLLPRLLVLALLLAAVPALADRPKSGTYELAYSGTPTSENVFCLVKLDVKDDGSVTAEVAATPQGNALQMKSATLEGDILRIVLKSGANDLAFEGRVGKAGEKILGSFGNDSRLLRASLTPTERTTLGQADMSRPLNVPEAFRQATTLMSKAALLKAKAAQTKDAEQKEKLLQEAADAQRVAATEVPKLHREVVAASPDTAAGALSATYLLNEARKQNEPVDQVARWAEILANGAAPHGPTLHRGTLTQLAEILATHKPYAPIALKYATQAEQMLGPKDSTEHQVRVLETLALALRGVGKVEEAKAADGRVAKLHEVLDAEYRTTMPPFKPTAYEGRKAKNNRLVILELFTGAQCPPCVAADLAFDGLKSTYKPEDVVLLQHHLHIPGPDPMTNADTEARWAYYRKIFPDQVRGVPTSVFNGKPETGGGGGVLQAEDKYKQYREVIERLLEEPAKAAIALTARQEGDTITMTADVSNVPEPGEGKRLRFLLAEEEIRFVGGNRIRFHHMVVRDMPGGPNGFALTEKAGKHTATVKLGDLKQKLTTYLDDFVANRGPFPQPQRPLDFKNLKAIALVQDDATGAILQAAVADLGGERAGR